MRVIKLIIKNGKRKHTSGLLLWDSLYTEVHFSGKHFPEFTKDDFKKAIEQFQKS